MQSGAFYLGVFLTALSTLLNQVLIPRVLSVMTWYHLAFFAISVAMFGLTAGGLAVYLRRKPLPEAVVSAHLARHALMLAIALPLFFYLSLHIRIESSVAKAWTLRSFGDLLAYSVCISVPFFFAGVVLTLALTRTGRPVGRVYAADLVGAAIGCLATLVLLPVTNPLGAAVITGAVAGLASALFGIAGRSRSYLVAGLLVAVGWMLVFVAWADAPILRLPWVKGKRDNVADVAMEEWNSFSRVRVSRRHIGPPKLWAASNRMAATPISQRNISIDGVADTPLYQMPQNVHKLDFLRFDVTALAYHLRPIGRAAVIGAGGGKDILTAVTFGHTHVLGLEMNPAIVDLVARRYSDEARIVGLPGVQLREAEARAYLASSDDVFDVIQMSMVDTWAATGAGAMSLTENGLYTVEGWVTFLQRLKPTGVLTVSRWFAPGHPNETTKLISVAVAALFRVGAKEPRKHILLAANGALATIVVGRSPFTNNDLDHYHKTCTHLGFADLASPNGPSATPLIRKMLSVASFEELLASTRRQEINVEPSTDEIPYFFNIIRLSALFGDKTFLKWGVGVMPGNLSATLTLGAAMLVAVVLALVTVILPSVVRRKKTHEVRRVVVLGGAAYFALIGLGFMLVEIALVQRLSLFLGHPGYSLSVVLFSIILFTGAGSYLSERIPVDKGRLRRLFPIGAVFIVFGMWSLMPVVFDHARSVGMLGRGIVTVVCILPIGLALGLCFPVGMRVFGRISQEPLPWFWAVNGACGVVGSVLAVLVSMAWGVSSNVHIACVCYLALVGLLWQACGTPAATESKGG